MKFSIPPRTALFAFLRHPRSWLNSATLGSAMVVLLWVSILAKHAENRTIDVDGTKRDLQNFALLFEENVLRSIGEMDKALLYLRRSISNADQSADFNKIVNTTDILSELIVQVAIIDANGIMRASNVGPQPAPPTDLSDREHFRFHVGRETDELFISKPLIGRASGKWSVQLTRRFLTPNGALRGVVVASFNPDHFKKFYGRIDLGTGATFSLIGTDGVVRAVGGNADTRLMLGQNLTGSKLMEHVNKGATEAFWDSATDKDMPHFVAPRTVTGHPLIVTASVPQSVVYRDSDRSLRLMISVGILLSLLIICAARRSWISETHVKQKTRQLHLTLEHMSQGIMMVTKDLEIPIINRKCVELLDLPLTYIHAPPRFDEMVAFQDQRGEFSSSNLPDGVSSLDIYGPKDAAGKFTFYERVRPDGVVIEVRSTRLADGGFVRTFSDITQRRLAQSNADRLASEDVLTGLANRRTLTEALERILSEQAIAPSDPTRNVAVLYLDLDRFKLVNDTRGHAVGDRLLQAVGQRLKESVRSCDLIGRLGGDEFAIILAVGGQDCKLETIAQRLVDAISRSYDIDGQQLLIGVSIGIAIAPRDGQTANELLISADLALYAAKAAGRCTYRFFAKEMNEDVKVRQQIETDLRKAIADDELELHYQPIINLQKSSIVGFEALARWRHPVQGMIPPDKFIPIAEECGLIDILGQWVLNEACRQASKWPDGLTVAVNLSPMQFTNPGLASAIERALTETGLPPERLEVEITEGLLMQNTEANLATLQHLKELGVRIAMDDFGTGYSSLAYLQRFPFDRIKIDRSFVSKLGTGATSAAIVRAIVDIANSRGIHTTAEGVETEDQRASLASLGCDEAQGYLFSRPVPSTNISQVIAKWSEQARFAA